MQTLIITIVKKEKYQSTGTKILTIKLSLINLFHSRHVFSSQGKCSLKNFFFDFFVNSVKTNTREYKIAGK